MGNSTRDYQRTEVLWGTVLKNVRELQYYEEQYKRLSENCGTLNNRTRDYQRTAVLLGPVLETIRELQYCREQ